jgi:hypothetical protein
MSKETKLKSTTIEIGHKRFRLELRENQRGRFVRLTESAHHHRRGMVIIPVNGLQEVVQGLSALQTQ